MIKPLPIRIRLTLWYFAMFASAAALLCVASLWMLRRSMDVTEFNELQERAEDVQLLLLHEDAGMSLSDVRQEFASIYDLKDDGKYLQVRDQQGNWLFRSKRMIAENPLLPAPDKLPGRGLIGEFHQGTRYVRVLAYPIVVNGKLYAVQTGIALNKSMALLVNFRRNLLLLTPAMILLAAVGGHFMSRKALHPVAVLAAESRLINDRNLDVRLPVPVADDEISDLSKTLNQMLERIDKAFGSVRAFTGNASHELRTPISLMRTEIEVALYRTRDEEEYRQVLRRLHEQAVRMTTLVESLLALARADGGAETMVLAPLRVTELFDRAMDVWSEPLKRSMLDFNLEIPDGDVVVLADKHGIYRLLSILLENSARYTPPGGCVHAGALVDDEEVSIFVRDTGIGISDEHLPHIFERFYRAAPVGDVSPGSGLGLALGKWIAERHGTKLLVESRPGRGTCFTFRLKRAGHGLLPTQAAAVLKAGPHAILDHSVGGALQSQ